MSYMAVGSRQILFSDSPVPAQARDSAREVSSLTDNQVQKDPGSGNASAAAPAVNTAAENHTGSRIDVRA